MTENRFRVGVHTSIAGGLPKAVESAVAKGCDGFQIFARNPRGWMARELERDEVQAFREARERANLWPLAIHAVYLINLAAQDPVVLERSRLGFREEIERALLLGADYLVVHPGSPVTAPADVGIITAVASIREAARDLNLNGLTILIENTAGQGSSIGCHFDQVADMLAMLDGLPVGVCLDTAHTLAAGYDITTEKGLRATMRLIEQSFGFERIKLIHCNDSKAPCGARVDRHQHIGEGHIGAAAFRRLTHTLKFRRIPFILETPIDRERDDVWNLNRLRELGA
ncbi:MAG: deoxyribonuclease IV [Blastocatellia bacterium]